MLRKLGMFVLSMGVAVGLGLSTLFVSTSSAQSPSDVLKELEEALKSRSEERLRKMATRDFTNGFIEAVKGNDLLGATSVFMRGREGKGLTMIMDLTAKSLKGSDIPFRLSLKAQSVMSGWLVDGIAFDVKQ